MIVHARQPLDAMTAPERPALDVVRGVARRGIWRGR